MENRKLAIGEKYLSVQVEFGGQKFKFGAFKNKEKKGKEPDFKGQGIGIWINTKKQGPIIEEDVL